MKLVTDVAVFNTNAKRQHIRERRLKKKGLLETLVTKIRDKARTEKIIWD